MEFKFQVFRRPTEMVKEKRKICLYVGTVYDSNDNPKGLSQADYMRFLLLSSTSLVQPNARTDTRNTHARNNQERANKKTIHFPTVAGRNHCNCLLTINTP
jgi:hypothetical protein